MDLNYQDWYNGTYQNYTDPRLQGKTVKCELCNNDAMSDDDFCENHQRCDYCLENVCECENE